MYSMHSISINFNQSNIRIQLPIGELGDSLALFSFSFKALSLADESDEEQNDRTAVVLHENRMADSMTG